MFDIKIVGEKGDDILLKGTPNVKEVDRLVRKSGMESTVRGVSVAEELLRSFSMIELTVSKNTGLPGKIIITGRINRYKVKTEIEYFKF